ncbi:MAG: DinB family protein [Ignavibacteriaceae bacterium]|nr:DinB family protein [Ignavibacteriaceae bacterium]
MFYKISDFQKDWAVESESTIKLLKVLTDKSLEQKVYEEGRTLGTLAWHLVCAVGKTAVQAGLAVNAVSDDSEVPVSAKRFLDEYEKSAKEILNAVTSNWTDESLLEEIPMFRDMWKKGQVLTVLIRHQIHHRAQMTVLMRQAGLKVPGVYGPSKEEWELMKMPPRQ